MKKYKLLAAMVFLSLSAIACDCGSYFGVQPQYNKNFLGLRFRYVNYFGNIWHEQGYTNLHTNSVDLWSRFYINPKIQLFIATPYVINQRVSAKSGILKNAGLGDLSFAGQYRIFSNLKNDSAKINHVLFAGGGIKVPTGEYKKTDPLGSGSYDFLVSADYIVRKGAFGSANNFLFRYNTKNKDGMKMGNNFRFNSSFYYWYKIRSISLLPQIGFSFEKVGYHKHFEMLDRNTGSTHLYFNVGADLYFKSISFSLLWQLPIQEKYNGRQLEVYQKIVSSISITF